MKLFVPFDDTQMPASRDQNDRLVPYQVGMTCADWYEIIPLDSLDAVASTSASQATRDDPYSLISQG